MRLLLDVWRSPRRVVRIVVDRGGLYGVFPLGALMGLGTLQITVLFYLAPSTAALMAAFSLVAGLVALGLESLAIWLSAMVLVREVPMGDIATAVAWGRVPVTVARLSVLPLIGVGDGVVPEPLALVAVLLSWAVVAVGSAWSWYTMAQGLGEALGVGAWRAVLVVLVAYLAPLVFLFVVMWLLVLL